MFNPHPIKKETASLITKDGISLAADIYRPDSRESLPILLMRQPYGKMIASTVVYAHPSWYARQGYIVVIQDVQGRGNSTGNFNLFAHEISDGLETIEWVLTIPNNTGVVGMYGFSYQGMTQLYAAANGHAALKTICPAMIAHDLYRDWAYENEAFNLQYNLAWAIQLAAETARLKGDETAYQKLWAASRNLPLFDPIAASPQILQDLAADSFYHDWITRYLPDDYWQNLSPQHLLKNIDLPMLHIGGWFDPHLRGTLSLYQEMQARSIYPQQLIIGAWTHLPWGRKVGEIDYGQEAISPVDKMQLQWFDYFLKGQETELLKNPPMYLFQMGSNQWRYLEKFPRENQQIYYLASQGLANLREDEGKLSVPSSNLSNSFVMVDGSPATRAIPSAVSTTVPISSRDAAPGSYDLTKFAKASRISSGRIVSSANRAMTPRSLTTSILKEFLNVRLHKTLPIMAIKTKLYINTRTL